MINRIKEHGETTLKLCKDIFEASHVDVPLDVEWAREGMKQLQLGYMSLVRSIARPTTFA